MLWKKTITAISLRGRVLRQIEFEPTRIYRTEDAKEFLTGQGIDVDVLAPQVDGKFMSAFIRAVKPAAKPVWLRMLQLS